EVGASGEGRKGAKVGVNGCGDQILRVDRVEVDVGFDLEPRRVADVDVGARYAAVFQALQEKVDARRTPAGRTIRGAKEGGKMHGESLRSAIEGVRPLPARRPSAGAVPGRRGACLAVRPRRPLFVSRELDSLYALGRFTSSAWEKSPLPLIPAVP